MVNVFYYTLPDGTDNIAKKGIVQKMFRSCSFLIRKRAIACQLHALHHSEKGLKGKKEWKNLQSEKFSLT